MSGIDERVVTMKFDNAQFERGIKTTIDSLAALNKGLQLQGATKGLTDLQSAAQKTDLGHIASAVENISSKFSALGVIGVTALANITTKAISAGTALIKSLTIDPISAGLESYNQQINATQVILANTAAQGTTLKQITATLAELQTYANLTVYSFSQMTENIGRFTAAGVPLKQATAAIKGLANVAALSGANTQQMSSAMYQMSQALSTGVLRLQDWNSLSNANMAGTNVQKAIEATAHAIGGVSGKNMDAALKKFGNFRQSLQSGWLTSDIFSKTMGVMAGTVDKATGKMRAFSVEELKQQGFSEKDAKSLNQLSQAALDSATKIRTIPQLMQALKEEVATAWGQVFKTIFGDINQATDLFSALHTAAENALTTPIYNLNKLLEGWAKLGGRAAAIDAIKNAFKALGSVLDPIKAAFREIFPPATAKNLVEITKAIDNFMKGLILSKDTMDNLKRTFAGFFAVLDIGWQIIKGVASVFLDLFGAATASSGGLLNFTAKIGDWLVSLDKALKKGKFIQTFFEGLSTVIQTLVRWLGELVGAFTDLGSGAAGTAVDKLQQRFSPLQAIGNAISAVWSRLGSILSHVWSIFEPIAGKMGDAFSKIGQAISDSLSNANWNTVFDAINTGLFAALVLLIKNFMGNLGKKDLSGGIITSIKESFGQLTDTLKAMQANLKANVLLKIAAAIGILTISVVALSMIDSAKLTKALTAITVMFVQLGGAMAAFNQVSTGFSAAKMTVLAAGLILLAIAIDILASAVKKLSDMNWNELAKGLLGVTVLIGALVLATKGMAGNAGGMVTAGAGLILLAVGIRILVGAVEEFSKMSWGDIAKGLTGVAALLLALSLYTKFTDTSAGGVASGVGIILLATGLKILLGVVQGFAKMSWGDMAKGLAGVAGGLTLIAAALNVIPPSSILSAAAIFIVAASLSKISDAMQAMGQMKWGSIAKGLVAMGGALLIISVALAALPPSTLLSAAAIFIVASSLGMIADALGQMGAQSWESIAKGLITLAAALTIIGLAMAGMTEALPGAAALLVVAFALRVLQPVLQAFGDMTWGEIAKGLVMLAAALAIIGIAGALLTPVIPTLLGLGIAIALIGAGVALAGAGLLLISTGLIALAAAGSAAAGALAGIVTTLVGLIPTIATALGAGVIAFAKVITAGAPVIIGALVAILGGLLDAVVKLAPKIGRTFSVLIDVALDVLTKAVPKMATAGMKILIGVLDGINKNLPKLVTSATNVIVTFINALAKNSGKITDAAAKAIVTFVNGLSTAIDANSGPLGAAGGRLATSIITGMVKGLVGGISQVASAAASLAHSAISAAAGVLDSKSPSKEFEKLGKYAGQGFVKGLEGSRSDISSAFATMKQDLKDVISSSKDDVDKLTAKLKKLKAARQQDKDAIKATTAALREAQKEHKNSIAAYTVLNQQIKKHQTELLQLSDRYAKVAAALDVANQKLADATKTRDDYKASVTDTYDNLPDINNDTTLADYVLDLQKKIGDTQTFATMIQKLRDLGLSDQMYKDLLSRGLDALPFMQQLLDGGKSAVDAVDSLGAQLDTAAQGMGSTASTTLYQAGVDAAQGVVDGLKSQEAAIQAQMDKIALGMVAAIKKALGIKSPSTVFAEVGKNANEGMAKGLEAYSHLVEDSADQVGKDAILALQKSISGMADLVGGELDLAPTVTPVLDLSQVQKDAAMMSSLIQPPAVQVGSAYQMAKAASTGYSANQQAATQTTAALPVQDQVIFNQYNSSPKALSDAEIYRQTKNQLSVAKGALTT